MALAITVIALALGSVYLLRDRQERTEFLQTDADAILSNVKMRPKALAEGRAVFLTQCASCHGDDARGSRSTGTPDLTDQDYLYGSGRASEIEAIVLHGIRSGDDKGWDLAWMPAYGHAVPYARSALSSLTPTEIAQLTSFLLAINGSREENPSDVSAGQALYQGRGGCWDCHSRDLRGDAAIGAPNLSDPIWLRGSGGRDDIARVIREGLHGVSPAFRGRLDLVSIRAVAVYVASLHQRSDKP